MKENAIRNQTLNNSPSSFVNEVNQAVEKGISCLLSQQHKDGYWWYTLEANDSINAEYIMLMHYLEQVDEVLQKQICHWIVKNQRADGSWALFYDGPGDLSTTVECYFALKLSGFAIDHEVMKLARDYILSQGGMTKIRIFSRIHFALFGLVDWKYCPQMPVALMQAPEWAPINIYEFSSWARASIVPLLIIMDSKPSKVSSISLDELYISGDSKKANWSIEINKGFVSLENAFIQIDRALRVADRMKLKPFRKSSLQKCEEYITEHLETTEDIWPAMFYGLLGLLCLGKGFDDEYVQKAITGLKAFQIRMPKVHSDVEELPFSFEHETQKTVSGVFMKAEVRSTVKEDEAMTYQQCCVSPVWDTAWAGVALAESGFDTNDPRILKAARWLLARQVTDVHGDWSVKNKKGSPGGWSFEFENKHYPDVDDTMEVLSFLYLSDLPYREIKSAYKLGVEWLLSMQSRSGGYGAFDVDNNLEILNKIPFSDHGACLDPATVDLTGRVIEFLMKYSDISKDHPAVQKAADFIVKRQEKDGSFWGRWGVNYMYGTWCALGGLCLLNRSQDKMVIQRSIKWLKSIQNEDGGFGESCLSDANNRYTPLNESIPSQTAWGLMALISAGEGKSEEARKAAGFLVKVQRSDGGWDEKHYTGTGFPEHFYIRYHGYRYYFPQMALARYLRELES